MASRANSQPVGYNQPRAGSVQSNGSQQSGFQQQRSGKGGRDTGNLTKSQERIYSAQQLVQALKSAVTGVRDQLQVLTILDSTAMSWPGMQQAVDDLEFLVDMSSQTTGRLEKDHRVLSCLQQLPRPFSLTVSSTIQFRSWRQA